MLLYLFPIFIILVLLLTNRMITVYKIKWGKELSLPSAYLLSLLLGIAFCVFLYHAIKFFYTTVLLLW